LLASEAPAQEIPLGSFERWSRRIRDPLLWLGAADPCASQDSIRQNDGKLEAQTELLKILYNSFQADTFKMKWGATGHRGLHFGLGVKLIG
jgi:hypothetical protein